MKGADELLLQGCMAFALVQCLKFNVALEARTPRRKDASGDATLHLPDSSTLDQKNHE